MASANIALTSSSAGVTKIPATVPASLAESGYINSVWARFANTINDTIDDFLHRRNCTIFVGFLASAGLVFGAILVARAAENNPSMKTVAGFLLFAMFLFAFLYVYMLRRVVVNFSDNIRRICAEFNGQHAKVELVEESTSSYIKFTLISQGV